MVAQDSQGVGFGSYKEVEDAESFAIFVAGNNNRKANFTSIYISNIASAGRRNVVLKKKKNKNAAKVSPSAQLQGKY